MKISSLACMTLGCVLLIPAFSKDVPESPASVELIEQLASDSYQTREEATQKLWEMGDEVLPVLEETADSDDPEAALRAGEILSLLELGLTPDTPDEMFSLIEAYENGGKEEKQTVLEDLKKRKAYRQLLVLYSRESAGLRAELSGLVSGVAIMGAREAIFRNDEKEAKMLLGIDPGEPANLMALATMYVSEGELDLEAIEPPKGVSTDLWRTTLLRARGDVAGATESAANGHQMEILAVLKMIQGDPLPWMGLKRMDFKNNLSDDPNFEAYKRVAAKRWSGGRLDEADFEPFVTAAESPDGDDRERAMVLMALLGRLDEFENFQKKTEPGEAFVYYLNRERIPEALEIAGLNPDEPDYTGWFAERMDRLDDGRMEKPDGFDPQLATEIAQMAGFLERRGLSRELADAMTGPLERFAVKNEEGFLDFLEQFLIQANSAPAFSLEFAAAWAGDDEDRWSDVYRISLGDGAEIVQWHDWVRKMKPGQSRLQALKATRAFLGISLDPENLRSEWIGIAWETISRLEGEEQKQLAMRLLGIVTRQGDVETSLRIYDLLGQSMAWRSVDRYLSAAGRWEEAANAFDDSGNNSASSLPGIHAFLAANYHRAGMEEKAAEHDRWVEKLTLGVPQSCLINARYYGYGGDYERAAMWRKRAILMADPDDNFFHAALEDYAKSTMGSEQWQVSSACFEGMLDHYADRNSARRNFGESLPEFTRLRLKADLTKAMAILDQDRERAIALLDGAHRNFVTDGILADDFFPIVRKAGLMKELDAWFAESWKIVSEVIEKYPASDNTRNTAAWLAARAGLKLEEAEDYLRPALDRNPNEPAYLDTMAELQFAKGNRKEAVRWSDHAVMFMPEIDQRNEVVIRAQNDRFRNDPLPE